MGSVWSTAAPLCGLSRAAAALMRDPELPPPPELPELPLLNS